MAREPHSEPDVLKYAEFLASDEGRRTIEEHVQFNQAFRAKGARVVRRRKPRVRSTEADLLVNMHGAGRRLHESAMKLCKAMKRHAPATDIAALACAFGQNLWPLELLPVPDPSGSKRDVDLHFGLRTVLGRYWKEGRTRDLFPTYGEVCQLWRTWCKKLGNPPTPKE